MCTWMFMEALFIAAKRKKKAKSLSARSRKCGIATQWNIVQQQKGVNYLTQATTWRGRTLETLSLKKNKNTEAKHKVTYCRILLVWNIQSGKVTDTKSRLQVARGWGMRDWGVTGKGHVFFPACWQTDCKEAVLDSILNRWWAPE